MGAGTTTYMFMAPLNRNGQDSRDTGYYSAQELRVRFNAAAQTQFGLGAGDPAPKPESLRAQNNR